MISRNPSRLGAAFLNPAPAGHNLAEDSVKRVIAHLALENKSSHPGWLDTPRQRWIGKIESGPIVKRGETGHAQRDPLNGEVGLFKALPSWRTV